MAIRKIKYKEKKDNTIEINLNDFKWLITNLWDTCNRIGAIPNMSHIEEAEQILKTIQKNELNQYIELSME